MEDLGSKRVSAVFIGRGFNHLRDCEDQSFDKLGRRQYPCLHLAIEQREDSFMKNAAEP
jgi:hypothetical protein